MTARLVTAIFVIAGIAGCSQTGTTLPSGGPNSGAAAVGSRGPHASAKLTIKFFNTPSLGAWPENIIAGPQGALWFSEFDSDKIGRITTSGQITEFPLPDNDDIEALTEAPMGICGLPSPAPTESAA